MPVEIIGEAGTPGASRKWINAECELAIKHLKKVCDEPPPEVVLTWEDAMRGAPWEYIEKCEEALSACVNR